MMIAHKDVPHQTNGPISAYSVNCILWEKKTSIFERVSLSQNYQLYRKGERVLEMCVFNIRNDTWGFIL